MDPVTIGIIGTGNISDQYLKTSKNFTDVVRVKRLADLDVSRAKAQADKYEIPVAGSVDELLADDEIEIVVNLTIPAAHAKVAMAALEAGKHTHSEKPFAVTREEGREILKLAAAKNLRVGCAPDTVLGAGHQTARKLLDDGAIGQPVGFAAFMLSAGPEHWHPNPFFYYAPGGGPMLDMGPYYLTSLVNNLGAVTRLTSSATVAKPDRVAGKGAGEREGEKIDVLTPDHVVGTLEFDGPLGKIAGTIQTSFAVRANPYLRMIEPNAKRPIATAIFGTEGTMEVPDPNGFDGEVRILRDRGGEWEVPALTHTTGYGRLTGVVDMAHAIRSGRQHRLSGEVAYHVLDVMLALISPDETGGVYLPETKPARPAMLPTGLPMGRLDD